MLGICFIISVIAVLVTADDIYDPFNIDVGSNFSIGSNVLSERYISKWIACYSHPLEILRPPVDSPNREEIKI